MNSVNYMEFHYIVIRRLKPRTVSRFSENQRTVVRASNQ